MVLGRARESSTPRSVTRDARLRRPARSACHAAGQLRQRRPPQDVQADLDDPVGIFVFPPFEGGYEGQADPRRRRPRRAVQRRRRTQEGHGVPHLRQVRRRWAKTAAGCRRTRPSTRPTTRTRRTRQIAKIVVDADVFRYDGSDLMPKEVGSGTFWTEMVKWLSGKTSQEAADDIEDSWPEGHSEHRDATHRDRTPGEHPRHGGRGPEAATAVADAQPLRCSSAWSGMRSSSGSSPTCSWPSPTTRSGSAASSSSVPRPDRRSRRRGTDLLLPQHVRRGPAGQALRRASSPTRSSPGLRRSSP